MSTESHLTPRTPDPQTKNSGEPKTAGIDLSPTKILGGALAAMTAAALGSQLSVAGTVIGAAVASIVAAVAGALYTASLEHTGRRVKTVVRPGARPTPELAPGWVLPAVVPDPTEQLARTDPAVRASRPVRIAWTKVAVGALAAFGLAAVALTGIELVSGHALSGDDGTTISQVSDGKPAAPKPTPSDDPTDEASPEEEASPEPTPSGDPTPSGGTTTEAERKPEPTPSASSVPVQPTPVDPTPSSTVPTPSATPTTATPSPVG